METFSLGKPVSLILYSTFSLAGTTVFEDNLGVNTGDNKSVLFYLYDTSNNFLLNGVYTAVTVTATFYLNLMKSTNGLFYADVKTMTLTSCNFTQNGYDVSGSSTLMNANLLYLNVLEGIICY